MEALTEQREEERREKENIEEEGGEEGKRLIIESQSPLPGPPTVAIMPTKRYQTGKNSSVSGSF